MRCNCNSDVANNLWRVFASLPRGGTGGGGRLGGILGWFVDGEGGGAGAGRKGWGGIKFADEERRLEVLLDVGTSLEVNPTDFVNSKKEFSADLNTSGIEPAAETEVHCVCSLSEQSPVFKFSVFIILRETEKLGARRKIMHCSPKLVFKRDMSVGISPFYANCS